MLPHLRRVIGLGGLALFVAAATARAEEATSNSTFTGAPLEATSPEQAARHIDHLLREMIAGAGASAPGACDDETFLRRASLDITGKVSRAGAIESFVHNASSNKRPQLIDRLLADAAYGQKWARYWRDVILYRRQEDRALAVANPLVHYLSDELNDGTAWDTLARDFIVASGNVRQEGHTAIYVAQGAKPEETAAEIARIFLGVQIQCAQCHDHPTDEWTREQFHELTAFLPRVALRPVANTKPRSFEVEGRDQFPRRRRPMNNRRIGTAEHRMPDLEDPTASGTLMTPKFFLTGESVAHGTTDAKRRGTLAQWITENPWFAKSQVNRIWLELVGWGFYEPVDDLGPDRDCTAPAVLNYLADAWATAGYDMRWLINTIALTEIYQRETASDAQSTAAVLPIDQPHRLNSDQLFEAVGNAFELEAAAERRNRLIAQTSNASSSDAAAMDAPKMMVPRDRRRGVRNQFNQIFGFDPSTPRDEVASSIPQALTMMNAPQIQRQINGRNRQTMLGRLLRETDDPREVTEQIYLRVLARKPEPRELKQCLSYVRGHDDRTAAFEDVLWALTNSAEFLYRN